MMHEFAQFHGSKTGKRASKNGRLQDTHMVPRLIALIRRIHGAPYCARILAKACLRNVTIR